MIESVLRVTELANWELGILQDNKVTEGINMHVLSGYRIIALDALSRNHGGVAILYQDASQFFRSIPFSHTG